MDERSKFYLEKKKIDSVLYTYDIDELLKLDDYQDISLNNLKTLMSVKSRYRIVDNDIKNNVYTLLQHERYNKENPNIDLINDIITLTNSSDDYNIDSYLYKEYLKRMDKELSEKNYYKKFYNYLDQKDMVKSSISFDFYYITSIINDDFDDYFKNEIVPDELVDIYYIYSINAALFDCPTLFTEDDKEKIMYILKQSKKLMNHMKCEYELEKDDVINLDLRMKTNKLIKRLK